jgi:hypothetical protein
VKEGNTSDAFPLGRRPRAIAYSDHEPKSNQQPIVKQLSSDDRKYFSIGNFVDAAS